MPVFWLATEDHDLAEVNQCFWLTKNGTEKFSIASAEAAAGRQVGAIKFGTEISGVVDSAARSLAGPFAAEVERALRESYAAGESFGSAIREIVRAVAGRARNDFARSVWIAVCTASRRRYFQRAIENAEQLAR